jgi:hypothetical protein
MLIGVLASARFDLRRIWFGVRRITVSEAWQPAACASGIVGLVTLPSGRNPAPDLGRVADRLTERLSGVNPAWFRARVDRSGSSPDTRADALRQLVAVLAAIGREAGSGAPPGAVPHEVGAHALADQVRVLARDVLAAPKLTPELEDRAEAAVRGCYDALWI